MRLIELKHTVARYLMMRSYDAYEQLLQSIRSRGDIWVASQGEYMHWWQERAKATLRVIVTNRVCVVESSLKDAVIEKYPGEFLETTTVPCEKAEFSGEVWITIDTALEKRGLLIEILRREGILNFRVAKDGEFLISNDDLGTLLEQIAARRHKGDRLFEADIAAVRQVIIDKLVERGLPLLRIWYHPQVNSAIIKAVFSPRYDVDRAITNMTRILMLEQKYGVKSTLYIRAFCPFYSDKDVKALASSGWHVEIGLHGEFVHNAQRFGDEVSAAKAEKEHLERIIGLPVVGICMHGGELTCNASDSTLEAIERAGFLYDTTPSMGYYFPVRPAVNGQFRQVYQLYHAFGDIKVPPGRNYPRDFYKMVMEKLDRVYEQNGVFVMLLHPEYFDFFAYLLHPKNFTRLARFFWNSMKTSHSL